MKKTSRPNDSENLVSSFFIQLKKPKRKIKVSVRIS